MLPRIAILDSGTTLEGCGLPGHSYPPFMRRLFLLLLCLPLLGAAAPSPAPVRYVLAPEMSGDAITALKVEVRFRADPSGTTGFGWDSGWGGEGRLWQWERDLRIAGAAAVEKNGDAHWRIEAAPDTELTATYRIVSAYDHDPTVQDSEQPKPVIRPSWFYVMGNALFARPDGRGDAPATFDWSNTTPGLGFASDLEHLAGRARKALRPGTVSDVLESVVIGGRDLRIFPDRHGSGIRLAIIGSYPFAPERLDSLARQVIGIERDFWKSDRGAPFLVTAAPVVGSPTMKSLGGTGRGDAFALWLDQQWAPLDQMKWLLAHEYFHTWNPARLGSMPADPAARPASYWFSEGFTDYYARALMVRAGVITPSEFASQWNEMLLAYAASPARNMTGAQAARAFWGDELAQKLPYQRGAMLAAIWNSRLLASSRGRINLDTVLKAQLIAAGSHKQDAIELFQSMAARRGLNIADDVNRYLDQGETITLPANTFGPCATVVSERRPVFSRGFDAEATAKAGNIVTGIDTASPAYAAGLRDGMKILERTEGETDNALVPYALLVEDKGQQRTIRYLPQGREQIVVQQLNILPNKGAACRYSLGGAIRA